jgi:hypothetical protein
VVVRPGYLLGLVAILLAGCAGPIRLVRPRACPAQGFTYRKDPELSAPRLERIFIPPVPVSTLIRGNHSLIRVVIDTVGRVMPDSITVCGISDPMYVQRMAEEVARYRFHPGLLHARHVVAPAFLAHDF